MMKLTYSRVGTYFIPDLKMDNANMGPIGKYGMLRETFLQEQHQPTYTALLLTGKLEPHLREIDRHAQEQVEQIVAEMMVRQSIDETFKARDPLGWVQAVNRFQAQAEEQVLAEVVYR